MYHQTILNMIRTDKIPPEKYRLELHPKTPVIAELKELGFEMKLTPICDVDEIILYVKSPATLKEGLF
jgi:hypothetical protein